MVLIMRVQAEKACTRIIKTAIYVTTQLSHNAVAIMFLVLFRVSYLNLVHREHILFRLVHFLFFWYTAICGILNF